LTPAGTQGASPNDIRPTLVSMLWERVEHLPDTLQNDFTAQGQRQSYMCSRWHHLEESGCWSNGTTGTVALFVPKSNKPQQLTPVVTGRVLGSGQEEGSAVQIETQIGDTGHVSYLDYESDDVKDFSLPIITVPADSDGPIVLTIARRIAFTPKDLDPNLQDLRTLGFQLKAVRLINEQKSRR
jgi:hypothetical protein